MREIAATIITEAIRDICIKANYGLAPDMRKVFEKVVEEEKSPLGRRVLGQPEENLEIVREDRIPICQDMGMAVVFMKIGQDVCITEGKLVDTINEGIYQGYEQGYLCKSVVGDPVEGINTKGNTPAVTHCEVVNGGQIDITVAPRGFGSENMSRVFMLKPTDGLEGVKKSVLQMVRGAGPSACSSMVVGAGIGGTFKKCTQTAKHTLTRDIEDKPGKQRVRDLEGDMLNRINQSDIGPGRLGRRVTALAANIETFATHIVDFPLAVSICYHVSRHARRVP